MTDPLPQCLEKFRHLEDNQDRSEKRDVEILQAIHELNSRLFVDNGRKSVITRLNEHETWVSVIKWFTITVCGGIVAGFIGMVFWIVRG